jgi:hypothetical protein
MVFGCLQILRNIEIWVLKLGRKANLDEVCEYCGVKFWESPEVTESYDLLNIDNYLS